MKICINKLFLVWVFFCWIFADEYQDTFSSEDQGPEKVFVNSASASSTEETKESSVMGIQIVDKITGISWALGIFTVTGVRVPSVAISQHCCLGEI